MSIILRGICNFILQVMLLLSILFLLRGHNYPGGGFIGALIGSAGVGLYTLSYQKAPNWIYRYQQKIIVCGILLIIISILLGLFFQKNVLTGIWLKFSLLGSTVKLGSPLLFDIGIYLSILGSISWLIKALEGKNYA